VRPRSAPQGGPPVNPCANAHPVRARSWRSSREGLFFLRPAHAPAPVAARDEASCKAPASSCFHPKVCRLRHPRSDKRTRKGAPLRVMGAGQGCAAGPFSPRCGGVSAAVPGQMTAGWSCHCALQSLELGASMVRGVCRCWAGGAPRSRGAPAAAAAPRHRRGTRFACRGLRAIS
jgi:hypothetical protein